MRILLSFKEKSFNISFALKEFVTLYLSLLGRCFKISVRYLDMEYSGVLIVETIGLNELLILCILWVIWKCMFYKIEGRVWY